MYDFMEKQLKSRNAELAASRAAASSATRRSRLPPRISTASERIVTTTTKKASHKIASTLGSYWSVQIEHKHKNATESCSTTNIARTRIGSSRIRRATSNLSTHNSSTTSANHNSNNSEEGSSSSSIGRKKRKKTASNDSVT